MVNKYMNKQILKSEKICSVCDESLKTGVRVATRIPGKTVNRVFYHLDCAVFIMAKIKLENITVKSPKIILDEIDENTKYILNLVKN